MEEKEYSEEYNHILKTAEMKYFDKLNRQDNINIKRKPGKVKW